MKQWKVWSLTAATLIALSACQSMGGNKTDNAETSKTPKTTTQEPSQKSSKTPDSKSSENSVCKLTKGDGAGGGRKVVYRCNANSVLHSEEAKSALDSKVSISFSGGGATLRSNLVTRQAARRFGTTDEAACQRAFINAAKKFQSVAEKNGGSRVTNYHSYYDRKVGPAGTYECEVGTFHARVVMRGNIAR